MPSADEAYADPVVPETPLGEFRVMHPLDVLQGRLENVYGLAEKQDEHGIAQLRLAINISVADAIDPAPVLHLKQFVTKKLPQLLKLMSETRRGQVATVPPQTS